MAGPTRVLLIEPDDNEAARITAALKVVATNAVVRVTTLAAALPYLSEVDVIISALNMPDVGDGTEALAALCEARSPDSPGVIVVVEDSRDEACHYVWQRSADCVEGVLFRGELGPESLTKAVTTARESPKHDTRRDPPAPPTGGRHAYAVGFSVEAVDSKLNRVLEEVRSINVALAGVQHSLKLHEDAIRKDREDKRRLRSAARNLSRRVKVIDTLIAGDSRTGVRPLAVRLEDVERSQRAQEVERAGWKNLAGQGIVQALPVLLTGVGALILMLVTYKINQAIEQRVRDTPPAASAHEYAAPPGGQDKPKAKS